MWHSIGLATARSVRVGGTALPIRLAAAATTSRGASHAVNSIVTGVISSRRAGLVRAGPLSRRALATATTTTAKKTRVAAAPKTKKATGQTAAKKKPVKKAVAKKAAPKKPAKRGRAKRELTPEEKEAQKEKEKSLKRFREIKELKRIALVAEQPKELPHNAWTVFQVGRSIGSKDTNVSDLAKVLIQEFRAMSSAEVERLLAKAKENSLANKAAMKAFVESKTPVEIDAANRARRRLKRIAPGHFKILKDERIPKRPLNPFMTFTNAKFKGTDFSTTRTTDVVKQAAQEWKNMSDAQKKPFYDEAKAAAVKYQQDARSVLGKEVSLSILT